MCFVEGYDFFESVQSMWLFNLVVYLFRNELKLFAGLWLRVGVFNDSGNSVITNS